MMYKIYNNIAPSYLNEVFLMCVIIFILNITLDIKVVLFSLTHAVVILMLLICALLHFLVRYLQILYCMYEGCPESFETVPIS